MSVSVCEGARAAAPKKLRACFVREPSALGTAGPWMSFPGDPEDCSVCAGVSLINSNTRVFGTCGQVNETQ